jgi:hypothetical protein
MKKAVAGTVLVVLLLATSAFAGNFNPSPSGRTYVVSCAQVQAYATALIAYISGSTRIPENLKALLIKAVQDAAARTPCNG